MKKLNLKLGGIREMLSREQMKKVVGGYGYADEAGCNGVCYAMCEVTYPNTSPQTFSSSTGQSCGAACVGGGCNPAPNACYAPYGDWRYLGMACSA